MSSLLAVNRHLNDNLTVHLLAKHLTAVVTVDDNHTVAGAATEPTRPATAGTVPDVPDRLLPSRLPPLGQEFSAIIRFSSTTHRLGLPRHICGNGTRSNYDYINLVDFGYALIKAACSPDTTCA